MGVQEAEKFRGEDEANRQKIEAKNGLENYCFTMRNTLNEEKLKDKFEGGDKEKIEKAVQDTLDWLDKNQLAEKDEFEGKQKELEAIVNPIMMKVYQAAGGGGRLSSMRCSWFFSPELILISSRIYWAKTMV